VTQDDRINLVNGYNLEIAELEPQDAGNKSKLASKTDLDSQKINIFILYLLKVIMCAR